MQTIGPACVFVGVHVTELPYEDFLCRGVGDHAGSDGSWAHLLAALTLQCAAKPYWWHGGQPAQATTYRVNVRVSGPRQPSAGLRSPPVGPTCGLVGPRARRLAPPRRHLLGGSACKRACGRAPAHRPRRSSRQRVQMRSVMKQYHG